MDQELPLGFSKIGGSAPRTKERKAHSPAFCKHFNGAKGCLFYRKVGGGGGTAGKKKEIARTLQQPTLPLSSPVSPLSTFTKKTETRGGGAMCALRALCTNLQNMHWHPEFPILEVCRENCCFFCALRESSTLKLVRGKEWRKAVLQRGTSQACLLSPPSTRVRKVLMKKLPWGVEIKTRQTKKLPAGPRDLALLPRESSVFESTSPRPADPPFWNCRLKVSL